MISQNGGWILNFCSCWWHSIGMLITRRQVQKERFKRLVKSKLLMKSLIKIFVLSRFFVCIGTLEVHHIFVFVIQMIFFGFPLLNSNLVWMSVWLKFNTNLLYEKLTQNPVDAKVFGKWKKNCNSSYFYVLLLESLMLL